MIIEIILISLAVLIFIVLGSVGYIFGTFNRFINGRINIKAQWSNIKTEYQRRADLFYNLAEAVKSYAKFEKDTLTQVIQARGGNLGNSFKEQSNKMNKLDSGIGNFLSRLLVVQERYPKLKANKEYSKLMDEVRITEDRINVGRTDYNELVRQYNFMIQSFPTNILAHMFHFNNEEFFENDTESNKPIRMNLKVE
jgi:LemA protein